MRLIKINTSIIMMGFDFIQRMLAKRAAQLDTDMEVQTVHIEEATRAFNQMMDEQRKAKNIVNNMTKMAL